MAFTINWQFQAAIAGGPSLAITQPTITVGAYDVIQVKVAAGVGVGAVPALNVPIQPAGGAGEVTFLSVTSSLYDPALTYSVDAVGTAHELDAPHLFLGSGAVGYMPAAAHSPTLLIFTNGTNKDANVQIVAGRNVP